MGIPATSEDEYEDVMVISCGMLTVWVRKYSSGLNAPVLSAKKGGGMANSDVVALVAVASKRGTPWGPLPSATVLLDVQLPHYDECKCKFRHVPKANMLTKLSSKLKSAGVVLIAPQARVASRMSRGTPSSSGPG